MSLGRCSHPVREERARDKSKSNWNKVRAAKDYSRPRAKVKAMNFSLGWLFPAQGDSQHLARRCIFWDVRVFASRAYLQMQKCSGFSSSRESNAESHSECPSRFLGSILDVPPVSGDFVNLSLGLCKEITVCQKHLMLCFTYCPAARLCFSWDYLELNLCKADVRRALQTSLMLQRWQD